MAKKKAAKKASTKKAKPDLTSQKAITIVVPDSIAGLDQKVLESIGNVALHAGAPHKVTHVAVVKTSQIGPPLGGVVPAWINQT
jgi:hypothetical protein